MRACVRAYVRQFGRPSAGGCSPLKSARFYLPRSPDTAREPDATHADTKLATPGHKTRNPHVRMTHAAHWPTATKRTTDTCTPLFQRNPRSGALTCARIGPDHLNDSSSLSPVENGVLTPRPPTLRSSARRANGDLTIAAATVANGGTAVQFAHAKRDLLIQCVCPLC